MVPLDDTEAASETYLVLGFGVVTVTKPELQDAVRASSVTAVGLTVTNAPGLSMGLGYTESQVVQVHEGAEDVRVEMSARAGEPIRVDAKRALLKPRKQERE
ncbi:MAG: hypothetical protein QF893_02885 [Alphaproteobacteria bacterium]|nr:hypothetical protein [Alphaproteobacteria bacterium]